MRRHPKTGKWQVRYADQWKTERSKSFDRKVDALAFKAEVEVAVARREFLVPSRGSVTLDEWCRSWLEGRGVRPSLRPLDEAYIRNYLILGLGRLGLANITFEQVQQWVRGLEDRTDRGRRRQVCR